MKGLFVTGTDTGIGKTVASAVLSAGLGWNYWKPVQTGDFSQSDCNFLLQILGESRVQKPFYDFERPISPHLAACAQELEIQPPLIIEKSKTLQGSWIVEGAGGVLVPLTSNYFIVDLIADLQLAALVVVPDRLGALNQALMTLTALKTRRIPVVGIIFNGHSDVGNAPALKELTSTPILGHLPKLSPFEFKTLLAAFSHLQLSKELYELTL